LGSTIDSISFEAFNRTPCRELLEFRAIPNSILEEIILLWHLFEILKETRLSDPKPDLVDSLDIFPHKT
jgi:hypothetical protein